ncbi:MAG: lamin tail domain-containing protein [Bacteroidales bacterium]|nr:lamin tail domain-containing protein [Bacteroidales bacterium]
MKPIVRFFLTTTALFFATTLSAQFYDDFLDGNLTADPAWQGTLDKFTITTVSAVENRLQLNDTTAVSGANRAYISTASQAMLNAEWNIVLDIKTTLTSGNYVRFYVATDQADLTAPLNGYFVWIGNTDKEIALYRQNGSKTTKIIDGTNGRATGNGSINVKLLRDADGNWTLYSQIGDEPDFALEGTYTDNTFKAATYAGMLIYYSKTNYANYACRLIEADGEPYIKPTQNIGKNDIVFTEIMADPDPQVELPNDEFLEIYNRTDTTIDLSGWTLQVNGKTATIAKGSIAAQSYAVLCADHVVSVFETYGNAIAVAPWNALTNSGARITLHDDEQHLVAWVDFSDAWYGNNGFKKDGGWSLERINTDYLDNHAENWQPADDTRGGTPAQPNSAANDLRDERQPRLTAIAAHTDTLTLHFSKSMDETTLADQHNFHFDLEIDTIFIEQPHAGTIRLHLTEPMTEAATYQLLCDNLLCVDGLPLDAVETTVALPVGPEQGDVIINEILFNPNDDGVDFVELYNLSDKTIDLSQLFVTRRTNGELEARTTICTEPRLFAPHTYLTLTSAPDIVCRQYDCPTDAMFATVKLPSLPDAEGNIAIALTDGTLLDELTYSAKMHHPFVSNPEGVSLERVNPHTPTQEPDNWQSAAFDAGYATPCRQNSQYAVPDLDNPTTKNFWLEHESFTPDNDGYRDLLQLNYRLPQDGFTATISIYTATGTRVRRLLDGELLATEGTITWNGRNDSDALCNAGVYVLFVEAVRPDGIVIRQKIVCALTLKG